MRKIALAIIALSFSTLLHAQEKDSFNFNFNHVAISVKDVDRSVAFYKKVLQLEEITNRTKVEGIRWMSLGENRELHLLSVHKEQVLVNKSIHFALTTNHFEAFLKRLDELKIPYTDFIGNAHKIKIRADGLNQIYFQDPDGYWIEINNIWK